MYSNQKATKSDNEFLYITAFKSCSVDWVVEDIGFLALIFLKWYYFFAFFLHAVNDFILIARWYDMYC